MTSIVICEKHDQAANVRAAIGDRFGRIYSASGHLYALAEPDAYGGAWTEWAGFHVYRPPVWKKVPTPGNDEAHQKRLDQARAAIAAALKSASRVYIATDCDREGEVIGREILDENGYRGEVFRVVFNADDPESLREAFAAPIPIDKRELIYQAGLARERADYIWNFSLTRAATAALVDRGSRGAIGVGRVKTPTLGITCRRELQIAAWKPSDAHVVRLTLDTPAGPVTLTSSAERVFPDKAAAEAVASAASGQQVPVRAETARKRQGPPKAPDLTVLQTTASRWGWPADKTLDIGQALYSTHKIMTYVRASTRYYPESAIPGVPAMLAGLRAVPGLAGAMPDEPVIRRGKSGIFSDEGLAGESHYGLMPNSRTIAELPGILARLSEDEARLFDLVCRLFLQTVMPDHEYEATKITAEIEGLSYAGSVRRPLSAGWRAVQAGEPEDHGDDDEAELGAALESGIYPVVKAEARPRQATAPRRYTQGTLIGAMLNAWQFVQDEQRRARLKDAKGIGTVATRDEVIRGLIDQHQLAEVKAALAPTKAGLELFTTLFRIDPRLVDPGTTAEWELQIDEIARGGLALDAFLDAIEAETARLVARIREEKPKSIFGERQPPTPAMIRAVEAIQRERAMVAPAGWRENFAVAGDFILKYGKKNAK